MALSFAAVRDQLRGFAAERDWDQFHTPRNLILALVGEAPRGFLSCAGGCRIVLTSGVRFQLFSTP